MTTLDTERVTVLGNGKRKIATTDRQGRATDRYEVRWRAHLRQGGSRGRPLTSYRTIIQLIAATATEAGLTIRAEPDTDW